MRLIVFFIAFINCSTWAYSGFNNACSRGSSLDSSNQVSRQIEWIKKIFKSKNCSDIEDKIKNLRSVSAFSSKKISHSYNTSIFKPFELTDQSVVPALIRDQEPDDFYNDLSLFKEFNNLTHFIFDPPSNRGKNLCTILKQLPSISSITIDATIDLTENEINCAKESNSKIYISGIFSITQKKTSIFENIYGIGNFQGNLRELHLLKNLTYLGIEENENEINLKELVTIQKLSNLYLNIKNIHNIVDISKIKNLKYLTLNCLDKSGSTGYEVCKQNAIKDIQFINSLKTLKGLDLSWNKITDISIIENLPKLQFLNLRQNYIKKIPDLSRTSNLKYLNLARNELRDLRNLNYAQNLTYLNLSFNQIDDFKNLANLRELKFLSIGGNNSKDFSQISLLHSLVALNLSDTFPWQSNSIFTNEFNTILSSQIQGEDKKYFENFLNEDFEKIRSGRISNSEIAIVNLERLRNLNTLILSGINFEEVPSVKNLKKLKYLDLSHVKANLKTKIQLPEEILMLNLQNSSNLVEIEEKTVENLEVLDLSYNKEIVQNIKFQKLRMISFRNCNLEDAPNFSNFPRLEYLDLDKNKISKFENQTLTKLAILDLSNNPIQEIPDFSKYKNIYSVFLYNTPITTLANVTDHHTVFQFDNNPIDKSSAEKCPKDSPNKSIRDYCSSL